MMRRASRQLFIPSPVRRAVLCLVSATGLGMLGAPVWAQAIDTPAQILSLDDTPLVLKSTPMLAETPPTDPDSTPPTFVFGDRISGRTDLETIIDGHAEVRRGKNATSHADVNRINMRNHIRPLTLPKILLCRE